MFELDAQLQQDCFHLGNFPLCAVLLMNDANYPWLILVPRREAISEIYQLSDVDQRQLIQESSYLARKLASGFSADKMNVAALGNVVPQLHIHHIVRYQSDVAWPGPVWGRLPARPYDNSALQEIRDKLTDLLQDQFVDMP